MASPAFTALPKDLQTIVSSVVKRKFDAYFRFTPNAACIRSTQTSRNAAGPVFTYSDESMISDLTVLWSLFSEVYELFKESKVDFARFFAADRTCSPSPV